jgi:hypothetical protein
MPSTQPNSDWVLANSSRICLATFSVYPSLSQSSVIIVTVRFVTYLDRRHNLYTPKPDPPEILRHQPTLARRALPWRMITPPESYIMRRKKGSWGEHSETVP